MDRQQFLEYLVEKQQEDLHEEVKEFYNTAATIFRLVSMTEGDETMKESFISKLDQAKEPWEQGLQIARMMKDEEKLSIGDAKLAAYNEIRQQLELM